MDTVRASGELGGQAARKDAFSKLWPHSFNAQAVIFETEPGLIFPKLYDNTDGFTDIHDPKKELQTTYPVR